VSVRASSEGGPARTAGRIAGVVGWPVEHSLSPTLHAAWIAALGLDAAYSAFAVPPEEAESALRNLAATGLVGVNVTVPHKEVALTVAERPSPRASRIGAANLLTLDADGHLAADNTDALGFLDGLVRAGHEAVGPVAILGAGGAARGVVVALADAACAEVRLVNRTPAKARVLAALAESLGVAASVHAWTEAPVALTGARLLVNATSLGMRGAPALEVPDLSRLTPDAAVYDLVYAPRETALLAAARACGLKAIEGLDMLIGQARPSFEAFFGVAPPDAVDARALLANARPANAPVPWPASPPW
jgi:shikimate dehydrogenase